MLISPGFIISWAIPFTACERISSLSINASAIVVSSSATARMLSFGIVTIASVVCANSRSPSSAICFRLPPSKVKGL